MAETLSVQDRIADDGTLDYMRDAGILDGMLLDIGCGTGWLLDLIDKPAGTYVGIDEQMAPVHVASAKHPGYGFARANPRKLTMFKDDCYDSVVCLQALCLEDVAPEIWRILKPGGHLFCSVPSRSSIRPFGRGYSRRLVHTVLDRFTVIRTWRTAEVKNIHARKPLPNGIAFA